MTYPISTPYCARLNQSKPSWPYFSGQTFWIHPHTPPEPTWTKPLPIMSLLLELVVNWPASLVNLARARIESLVGTPLFGTSQRISCIRGIRGQQFLRVYEIPQGNFPLYIVHKSSFINGRYISFKMHKFFFIEAVSNK